MAEVLLPWAEQEDRHPEFKNLLELPFDELIALARTQLLVDVDTLELASDNPDNEWAVIGTCLTLLENEHATESVQILLAKRSISAVYKNSYKGAAGAFARPSESWAIARDDDGALYYWNQARHGASASAFTLGVTECDEVPADHLSVTMMRLYVSLALYGRAHPDADELKISTIPPFDLKQSVGVS